MLILKKKRKDRPEYARNSLKRANVQRGSGNSRKYNFKSPEITFGSLT